MAQILGSQEFWNLSFEVTRDVLIPRPETEGIVEAVLEHRSSRNSAMRAADVCTGSGCLAVVLATLYPRWRLIATDVSLAALRVAERNVNRHGVGGRVSLLATDLLGSMHTRFDVIVSNPPYVPEGDRLNLPPEVRDHEPGLALFAGANGLDVIARLISDASQRLNSGGLFIFEFGFGQEAGVRGLVGRAAGLRLVAIRPDLQGIPRTAVAMLEEHP
jgi:release factor glutamine methyltransferase